jgi:CHAT domain-containing protein
VLVTDVSPPATLRLPALAPVTDPDAVLVSGAVATPSRVRSELRDAGYLEIHAHGIVDLDASDAAFIALSPDADGRYALTAADVRATRLAGAPIVVLAACHAAATARYQARRWSLPDAFLVGGARAVIASAAAIPDDQGAAMFAELRARIVRGEPAAQAVAALRADRIAKGQRWAAGLMVFE